MLVVAVTVIWAQSPGSSRSIAEIDREIQRLELDERKVIADWMRCQGETKAFLFEMAGRDPKNYDKIHDATAREMQAMGAVTHKQLDQIRERLFQLEKERKALALTARE